MSAYTDLKNHIHNTLSITKKDIRSMVEKSVEKIVERKIDTMFPDQYSMEQEVLRIIRGKSNTWWLESEDSFDDYIKKQVVAELLRGVKLKVDIAKTKSESTQPYPTAQFLPPKKRKK